MSDDIANQLESIQSRIRTLESTYRSNDRQVQLQRLGQGPTPRQLGYSEPVDSRMGVSSGFGELGGVQPWHGQSNLLYDPTFESSGPTGTDLWAFTTGEGTGGEWHAFYVLNSGTSPGVMIVWPFWTRANPNDNPFSSTILIFVGSVAAGGGSNFDIYFYPVNHFSPGSIPRLPYLVAAVRWVIDWNSVGGGPAPGITTTMSMQLVEMAGPTVVAESAARTSPSEEGQLQLWCSTDLADDGDWQWRLKIHIEVAASGSTTDIALGIAEPQLHYAYTPDPIPFQPAIAMWSQPIPDPSFATPVDVGAANATGAATTLVRSDHVHAGATTGHTHAASGTISGIFRLNGIISPSALSSGNTNDWNPTGLSTCNVIRVSADAANSNLTGLVAQDDGRVILLVNTSSAGIIAIQHASGSSTGANRFACPGSAQYFVYPEATVFLWRDGSSSLWRIVDGS